MMILDSHGRPLVRSAGFIGGYVLARKAGALIGALQVVGSEIAAVVEEEDGEDDAAPGKRMRR